MHRVHCHPPLGEVSQVCGSPVTSCPSTASSSLSASPGCRRMDTLVRILAGDGPLVRVLVLWSTQTVPAGEWPGTSSSPSSSSVWVSL